MSYFNSVFLKRIQEISATVGKVIGSSKSFSLHPDVKDLLHRIFNVSVETVTIFYIAEVRGGVYYSRQYKRLTIATC